MPALTVSSSIVGTTMGRTFSAVPYTYLKRGVYYFVICLILGLQTSLVSAANWNQKPISEGEVYDYGSWSIPEEASPKPNLATLRFYLKRYLSDKDNYLTYESQKSDSPRPLIFNPSPNSLVTKKLSKTALFSYILVEDGEIKIDALSPENRFGDLVDNDTPLYSMSVGKSMVSYVLGHAICSGLVESVDEKLTNWPLIKDTLYEGQPLLNLLNARAGDQNYVAYSQLKKSNLNVNSQTLETLINTDLRGSKPSTPKFNYGGLPTNVILNYLIHKTNGNFNELMNSVFTKHVKTESPVLFVKNMGQRWQGLGNFIFYAKRYDYVRIAKTMIEDWKNDSCVGRYLKTIYDKRQSKVDGTDSRHRFWFGRSYGGFFHMDFPGMTNRPIFAMDGYGGQLIWIDFETGRTVYTQAVHDDFGWRKMVYDVMRKGSRSLD